MIVLDAYAVIALLRDEPAASEVQRLIESDSDATLTVLGLTEVLDYLVRLAGVDEDEAVLDLAQLGLTDPPALTPDIAVRAGLLRARHYRRRDRAPSLAGCVAAETARSLDAPLATSDPHLLATCAAEGIATVVLPGSAGACGLASARAPSPHPSNAARDTACRPAQVTYTRRSRTRP